MLLSTQRHVRVSASACEAAWEAGNVALGVLCPVFQVHAFLFLFFKKNKKIIKNEIGCEEAF